MVKVNIIKVYPGQCTICEADLFSDQDTPYYIEANERKMWLCETCGEGLQAVFRFLDIPFQVSALEAGRGKEE
ncbi:hypothetical protein ES703_84414 [subsurface metagenome]